jgi:hypothetical protein
MPSYRFVPLFDDAAGGPTPVLVLQQQTDMTWQVAGMQSIPGPLPPTLDTVTIGGLATLANMTGISNSPEKNTITDALRTALVTLVPLGTAPITNQLLAVGNKLGSDSLLASVPTVNMNQDAATPLFTVPATPVSRSCIITMVVLRACSGSLTTASISFGFTSPTFADVIANAAHTELTGATLYTKLLAKAGALVGTAGQVFSVICNTKQGGAMTLTVDVYGYLF